MLAEREVRFETCWLKIFLDGYHFLVEISFG